MAGRGRAVRGIAGPRWRAHWLPGALLTLFVVLTVLVQLRALAAYDLAVSLTRLEVEGPFLEVVSAVTGVLCSVELSLTYGLLAALFLWRRGLRLWALAPLAFIAVTPLELLLKRFIAQPYVPDDLHSTVPYPLTAVAVGGAFPSGHALRAGFFLTFVAVLCWQKGGTGGRVLAICSLLLSLFIAYTRVYVGDHWLSDVVAGWALGAATALLVAGPVMVGLCHVSAHSADSRESQVR